MTALDLKHILIGKRGVVNVDSIGDFTIKLVIGGAFFRSDKSHIVYVPEESYYLVTAALVDKGVSEKANLVVCDDGCEFSQEGLGYAKSMGVQLIKYKDFIRKIENGEKI